MDARAFIVGGSWAGSYTEFRNAGHGHIYEMAERPFRLTIEPTPATLTAPVKYERYTLHRLTHGDGNVDWFAVIADNTLEWAINQLKFAYATAHDRARK